MAHTDLFNIIKSLSKSEKRFFKLFASIQNAKANFLVLFDAIEKLTKKENGIELYKNGALEKMLSREKFLKSLPYEKNYLYNNLLKVLRNYHLDDSASTKISSLLHNARILVKKRLYSIALSNIEKAKEIALEYDKYEQVLEIMSIEHTLARRLYDFDKMNQIKDSSVSFENYFNKIINKEYYNNINTKMLMSFQQFSNNRDDGIIDELHQSAIQPDKEIGPPNSFESEIFFNRIIHQYYFSKQSWQKSLDTQEAGFKIYDRHPHQKLEYASQYIESLWNLAVSFGYKDQKEKSDYYKQELVKFSDQLPVHQKKEALSHLFLINAFLGVGLLNRYGKLSGQEDFVDKMVQEHLKYKDQVISIKNLVTHLHFSVYYFGIGSYDKTLHHLAQAEEFINDATLYIQISHRLFTLLTHYELKNDVLISYLKESTARFLKKKGKVFDFERIMLKFLQKITKETDKKKIKRLFQDLQSKFIAFEKSPSEGTFFNSFDFIAWTMTKTENISFEEALQERYKKATTKKV